MLDCIVVGGGAIGCAIALGLRGAGLSVAVVERGPLGGEASSAAAGMLAPQAEANSPGPFLALALASRARWPAFAAALAEDSGVDVAYRHDGALVVAHDEAELLRLEARAAWQRAAGLAVERLDTAALAACEPALAPARGALRFPGDHQVDNRRLVRALAIACARAGVRHLRAAVRRLRHDGGRVAGVDLDGAVEGVDALDAGQVVLAAGAWSALVAGVPLPAATVAPVRGQMLELEAGAPPFRHLVFGAGGYAVPRTDGRVLVGSTEEHAGFVKEVTPRGLAALAGRVARLCPALTDRPVASSWAGLRPATRDRLPLLGPSAIAGLTIASGHYRNGILLTPITADIITALVAGATPPVDVSPFSPTRPLLPEVPAPPESPAP